MCKKVGIVLGSLEGVRRGLRAQYFEHALIDHDVASNVGNWQTLAGVGWQARESVETLLPVGHWDGITFSFRMTSSSPRQEGSTRLQRAETVEGLRA